MDTSLMKELCTQYPLLEECAADIQAAAEILIACYENGGKVLICGNGGSSADSEHIVGELMKGFVKKRPLSSEKRAEMKAACPEIPDDLLGCLQGALPAISLTGAPALSSAFGNDVQPEYVMAQQVMGYGKAGDVLLGMSTSGNAANVCAAAMTAKALGLTVIGLTGKDGGKLSSLAHYCIAVPEKETYKVQELHLPVYHALCLMVESRFFAV